MKKLLITLSVIIAGIQIGYTQVIDYQSKQKLSFDYIWKLDQQGQLTLMLQDSLPDQLKINLYPEQEDLKIAYNLKYNSKKALSSVNLQLLLGDSYMVNLDGANAEFSSGLSQQPDDVVTLFDFMDLYPEWIQEGEKLTVLFEVDQLPFASSYKSRSFTFAQQIPNYALILAGAGSYLYGRSLRSDAEDIYNQEYTRQIFADEAEPIYERAEEKREEARIFEIVGIGLASLSAADLAYKFITRGRPSNKQRSKKVGLQIPTYQQIIGTTYTNFTLTYTF